MSETILKETRLDDAMLKAIKAGILSFSEALAIAACVNHIYKSGCLVSNQPFTKEYGTMVSNSVADLLS